MCFDVLVPHCHPESSAGVSLHLSISSMSVHDPDDDKTMHESVLSVPEDDEERAYDILFDIPISQSAVDEVTITSISTFHDFVKLVAPKLNVRSSALRLLYRTSWTLTNEKARVLIDDDPLEGEELFDTL